MKNPRGKLTGMTVVIALLTKSPVIIEEPRNNTQKVDIMQCSQYVLDKHGQRNIIQVL